MAGIVVLAGPTAVGKTALITRLAEEYPLEVISLDSRQVYHGLRIGTAQPTTEEQAVAQRIARVESENKQLRRSLEEAEQKLDAITSIERSIREQTDNREIQN